ncbi:acetylglutamate kinase [Deinococcus sp. KNUC1210]|uniref:acetylglutamate kinase n=1 Tax=Deinococcus sp. KNUC1210 TaxID=2917691 RepID=UPI001EF1246D|nr:acetylglutamate kinase [Deinococcus sp. KNUC1210]ULH14520.1 acetylglutamate kinase [Deinococcus sp. KNUC1210]
MIIKYGGNAMKSVELRRVVAREIGDLRRELPVVVVHGGGPVIERELTVRGIESRFVDGLRFTSPEAMDAVEMALCKLNKELSQDIGDAVGLMGRDSDLLRGELLDRTRYGRVGQVTGVNTALLHTLLAAGITPVLGCLAVDADGEVMNVNADTSAGAVAGAMQQGIVFLTDVAGVYRSFPDPASLAPELTHAEVVQGMEDGWIAGGMIPKVGAALSALDAGAPFAVIASGMQAGVLAAAVAGSAGTRLIP